MSKPMLVTLPFLLLLLDFWPLRRAGMDCWINGLLDSWKKRASRRTPPIHQSTNPSIRSPALHHSSTPALHLLLEKLPFFALSALFSVLTLLVQTRAGATVLAANFTLGDRVTNAVVSYVRYLGKMFWPTDLAVIYPHPASRYYLRDQWPGWEICAAALLLLAVTALCLRQFRRRPWLAVGWFWYLGMLVPVIGLIQAGEQSMADRYTYLPLIGIFIAVVWGVAEWGRGKQKAVGIKQKAESRKQKSESRLTPHASAVPSSSTLRSPSSAVPLRRTDATEDGTFEVQCSTFVHPPQSTLRSTATEDGCYGGRDVRSPATMSLAVAGVLALAACAILTRHQLRYWRDSVSLFQHTVEVTADNPGAQFGLGVALEHEGRLKPAMVHYRVAISILPSYAEAYFNLGHLLRKEGAREAAAKEFLTAIHYEPGNVKFRLNLAGVLMELGQAREPVQRFEEVLQMDPDSTEALNNLAWLLATSGDPAIRNGARAVEYGERACQLTQFKQTVMVGTLAAAYAEAGRFADAVATAERACALAAQNGEPALLEKNRQLLELYRAGKPCHEPAPR